ncbi:hypothetical protein STEG23_029414, partial [Scotinomys teguina]
YNIAFKIKYIIPLTSLWIGDCVVSDFVGFRQTRKSIHLGWPMENFIATFRSLDQKKRMVLFPSKPFTITATHLDTVSDIVKKLKLLLGIPSAGEDYQLCSSSDQEEAPCPPL